MLFALTLITAGSLPIPPTEEESQLYQLYVYSLSAHEEGDVNRVESRRAERAFWLEMIMPGLFTWPSRILAKVASLALTDRQPEASNSLSAIVRVFYALLASTQAKVATSLRNKSHQPPHRRSRFHRS